MIAATTGLRRDHTHDTYITISANGSASSISHRTPLTPFCFLPSLPRGTMPFVADRSVTSGGSAYRDVLGDRLLWRLTVVGTAALGFLATFLLLDHEIRLLKN